MLNFRIPVTLALSAIVGSFACAQDAAPATDPAPASTPEEKIVLGEVIAANVNVRAGNTMNHRIVCIANKGDQVLILEEAGDFFKIMAPKGASCWVACQFVERKGDTAIVNANNVNLRPTPDTSHPVIGQLASGDPVKILGQDNLGTWFRIEPPKGVIAYVSKKFIAVKGNYADITREAAREESARIATEERALAGTSAWRDAEALARAENEKPAAERDWTASIEAFRSIGAAGDPKLAQRAEEQVKYLEGLQELQALVRSLDATSQVQKDGYERKIAELESKWQSDQAAKAAKKAEKSFIVQGWVEEVGSLFGRPGTHKIVEAGVTLYYLKSETYDLRRYWHNRIRIVKGTVKAAPDGWEDGPKVIEVEELEVLE